MTHMQDARHTMKVAVWYRARDLRVENVVVPTLKAPHQVKVKMALMARDYFQAADLITDRIALDDGSSKASKPCSTTSRRSRPSCSPEC
ncbi:hypothetical protein A8U91_00469 [Halomonas elongata]|uniref:Uncharacterized protein n=1 Tax=Halomonas elongata TaxID=2746 RepID=A0A1B8P1R9_HALEL|nr:hypothetical protein A8U91_00469 [Halomonas elongata]